MANTIVEPTFSGPVDRLEFLSRLWGVRITAQDVLDWEAYKATRPVKLPGESDREYRRRLEAWHDDRKMNRKFYILSKWESYALGKVRPAVESFLATRPTPTRAQARQAVGLQLRDKWGVYIAGQDVQTQLLPLVQGIVW